MFHRTGEHRGTAHAGALRRFAYTEQCADVTQMGRREQRVDHGVHHYVAIGITFDSVTAPCKGCEHKGTGITLVGEPMRVEPLPYAQRFVHFFFDFLFSDSRRANVSAAASSGACV